MPSIQSTPPPSIFRAPGLSPVLPPCEVKPGLHSQPIPSLPTPPSPCPFPFPTSFSVNDRTSRQSVCTQTFLDLFRSCGTGGCRMISRLFPPFSLNPFSLLGGRPHSLEASSAFCAFRLEDEFLCAAFRIRRASVSFFLPKPCLSAVLGFFEEVEFRPSRLPSCFAFW